MLTMQDNDMKRTAIKDYKARSITTTIIANTIYGDKDEWTKFNITFPEYKVSLKRHLGNLSLHRKDRGYYSYLQHSITEAKSLVDIMEAFKPYRLEIKITVSR